MTSIVGEPATAIDTALAIQSIIDEAANKNPRLIELAPRLVDSVDQFEKYVKNLADRTTAELPGIQKDLEVLLQRCERTYGRSGLGIRFGRKDADIEKEMEHMDKRVRARHEKLLLRVLEGYTIKFAQGGVMSSSTFRALTEELRALKDLAGRDELIAAFESGAPVRLTKKQTHHILEMQDHILRNQMRMLALGEEATGRLRAFTDPHSRYAPRDERAYADPYRDRSRRDSDDRYRRREEERPRRSYEQPVYRADDRYRRPEYDYGYDIGRRERYEDRPREERHRRRDSERERDDDRHGKEREDGRPRHERDEGRQHRDHGQSGEPSGRKEQPVIPAIVETAATDPGEEAAHGHERVMTSNEFLTAGHR